MEMLKKIPKANDLEPASSMRIDRRGKSQETMTLARPARIHCDNATEGPFHYQSGSTQNPQQGFFSQKPQTKSQYCSRRNNNTSFGLLSDIRHPTSHRTAPRLQYNQS